ncbi:MAG: M23 family metallopeptidase [Desulfuromonadaceae bacterium]|nr:M23 family metallopeptidase [Desulfuromonadaceae bacterium]
MELTTRKCIEEQAEFSLDDALREQAGRQRSFRIFTLLTTLTIILNSSFAGADIYRFITTDGVETFTDAPSNKSATVIIKDKKAKAATRLNSSAGQNIYNISLEEIVQKTVSASLESHDNEESRFEPNLPQVGGTITSKVGMRTDPIDGKWRQHNGIDIAIPSGTPVKPVASGVVVYSGRRSGYGNTIIVEHANGLITLYAHNNYLLTVEGQSVTSDSTIALSGSTGRSTGPHLHFEAWQTGTNVTEAFLPDSRVKLSRPTLVASSKRADRFRSETLSDGSILFTNIPSSTP